MPRTVRFMCHTDGPLLVSHRFPTLAPMRAVCPKCGGESPRARRPRRGTKSISVRAETLELLKAESKRTGKWVRKLVEEYTRDIK